MKKILGIIALFAIVFSSSASAAIIGADYEFNPRENAYVVYGVSDDEKSGDEITIEVKLNNNVIDTVVTETYSDDGTIRYKSPLIKINAFKESGEISFNVYSANYDAPITLPGADEAEILYYGVDAHLYQLLSEIDAVLPVSDKSECMHIQKQYLCASYLPIYYLKIIFGRLLNIFLCSEMRFII